nr:MAG TPA: hypothetical protein [Bacteriophage sp.]
MRANVFCVIPDIVLCFYVAKVTIFPVPHTDILNLPVPHHVRIA